MFAFRGTSLGNAAIVVRIARDLPFPRACRVPLAGVFAGFVSNRILMPMINEAIFTLAEGVASASDIDTVMKLGMNHPMGPLNLADFIGLDTCLAILEVLHAELGDDKYRPAPLLRKYVRAGLLGKKTGEGFFRYDAAPKPVVAV